MMKARKEACKMIQKAIGDGKSTALWLEPWVGQRPLVQSLGLNSVASIGNLHDTVSHFISDKAWNQQVRKLPAQTAKCIARIKIFGGDDFWKWTAGGERGFTFKSCWNCVRVPRPEVEWYNLLWFTGYCPKFSVCTYKAMHGRLLTLDRLATWGIATAEICVLCQQIPESHEHLFFQCSFSKCIWINMCRSLGLQVQKFVLPEVFIQFVARFRTKNQVFSLSRLAFTATVWHLWRERNNRVFKRGRADPVTCIQKIKEDVRILMVKCLYKTLKIPANE